MLRGEDDEERVALRDGTLNVQSAPGWKDAAAHPAAFIRSWPSPYCNLVALLSGLLAFIFFVSTITLAGRSGHAAPRAAACALPRPSPQSISVPIAAVAADEARCSVIGAAVLAENGTAVDAAVATALCLGVVHPHSSGIGGGCFILIYTNATGDAEVIDARETAPASAREDMFVGKPQASLTGGAAVAVPGELAGLWLAWQRHGSLPWARLVAPAAALADGFAVNKQLAAAISANAAAILNNAPLASVLMPRGVPLLAGEMAANRALAATLRAVAAVGVPAGFYRGARAASLVADVRAAGGNLSLADLANYTAIIRAPLRADTELGLTLLGAPPPSSGGAAVAFIANFMGGYTLPFPAAGLLSWHRTVEGFKHAFAARMSLGDPMDPFVANNTASVSALLSPAYADAMRAVTSDTATQPAAAYGGSLNPLRAVPDDHGTTHLSVVDGRRNAVALTSTVNTAFGAKVLSLSTGVVLNNEMDDFSSPGQPNTYGLAPSVANYIRPGKRPLSSMSPTVVLQNGRLRACLGASGGPRIITATAQALLRVMAGGQDAADAVAAPRLHHQLLPEVAWAEGVTAPDGTRIEVPAATVAALRARGHVVNATENGAVVQMIVVDPDSGALRAVSDLRKGGAPAGF